MTLEDTLAQAISDAFWETAEQPQRWASMPDVKRQVFRNCARAAIAAGKAFKAAQSQPSGAQAPTARAATEAGGAGA